MTAALADGENSSSEEVMGSELVMTRKTFGPTRLIG